MSYLSENFKKPKKANGIKNFTEECTVENNMKISAVLSHFFSRIYGIQKTSIVMVNPCLSIDIFNT